LEAADCALLSLNMAWDARYQSAAPDPLCRAGEGPPTAAAAAARALSLLSSLAPPAPPSSPAPAAAAGAPEHAPGRGAWGEAVGAALGVLRADDAARYRPAFGVASLDPEMAKQEFINGGQQGLDDLLEALGGGNGTAGDSSGSGGDNGAAGDGMRVPRAAGGGGAASGSSSGSRGGGGGAAGEEAIIKLVLARRTAWPLERRMGGVALLEALQERDPRAYQLYLSVPGEEWVAAVAATRATKKRAASALSLSPCGDRGSGTRR
jgi:hypothetical protein